MPSSISNSDLPLTRPVPKGSWLKLAGIVSIFLIMFCAGWELWCRHLGYMPTLNDNPYQWALIREKVNKADQDDIVIIGSSRALFDLRLDVLKKLSGREPLQLSIVGSSPLLILQDLAENTNFSGTIICGVSPVLFFAPGGPPMDKPVEWLKFHREFSPSQRIGQYTGIFLQKKLAFIQQEDLTLPALLDLLPIGNRPRAQVPPKFPPFLYTLETNRQAALLEKVSSDPSYASRIQLIWQGLFTVPGADDTAAGYVIGEYARSVETIRARGGKIIFVRPPSTGWLLEKENEITPRRRFWDRLIQTTGTAGYHFQDYIEQARLDCPEWSHLTEKDSFIYTESLSRLLRGIVKDLKN